MTAGAGTGAGRVPLSGLTPTAIEARQIVRSYEGRTVVDHVDLRAGPGQVTAIIGPNGAGKTTLFDSLSGEEASDSGRVLLGDVDVTDLPPDERTRRGLARTFQHSTVFGTLTVEENLRVGAENHRRDGIARGLLGLRDRRATAAHEAVEQVLGTLGLRAVRYVPGNRLPTGLLRLVELGRALCSGPSVLLLDEPASGLDDAETEGLHQTLRGLADTGLTLLLIEHDLDLVRNSADVLYVMAQGRVMASGPPDLVIRRADVRAVALGIRE